MLAAVNRDSQEEHPRNKFSRDTNVPRIKRESIRQLSEKIIERVTKKLSRELSRAKSRILGASSELDEFLVNSQVRADPEPFRKLPGLMTGETTNVTRTVPKTILILNWVLQSTGLPTLLIQTLT